jgi:hypothetical protein
MNDSCIDDRRRSMDSRRSERRLHTRRDVIRSAAIPIAFPLVNGLSRDAAAETYQPLNRFPRMVHEYFVDQVRRAERRNLHALEQLKSADDAQDYVESVRAKIRKCFGPEPKRTPLNPRITGVLEREGYKIEKLIFDSRPGFPVTANLYVPLDRDECSTGSTLAGTTISTSSAKAGERCRLPLPGCSTTMSGKSRSRTHWRPTATSPRVNSTTGRCQRCCPMCCPISTYPIATELWQARS